MSKNQSNGNLKVGWILDASLTTKPFPTAANLTANAFDMSQAISWLNFKVGATKSADIQDRALTDVGNAISRGAAAYAGNITFFREKFNTDTTSVYQQAFQAFRSMRTLGWIVLRENKVSSLPWTAGDEISMFKFIADVVIDETVGDNSTKFTVNFMPQASLFVHTMVGAAGVMTGVPSTLSKTVAGGAFQLQPIVGGASVVSRATYTTSDPTKATVSVGGTVTPIAAGSPIITVTYGAATAAVPCTLTLT